MANGWESQKLEKSSLTDLLQLVNSLQGIGEKDRDTKNSMYQSAMNDIGGDILKSFDDVTFKSNISNLDEYYNRNLDNFDEDTIELYTYLKEKSKTHEEKYKTFDAAFDVLDVSGRSLTDKFTEYNDADPLDKERIKNEIVNMQVEYINNKESVTKKYGDFLIHPSGKFQVEVNRMATYDNMFHFGLESIASDDNTPYAVDKQELATLSQSITSGNLASYQRFIETEASHKGVVAKHNLNLGGEMIQEVNIKGDFLDKQGYMFQLDRDANDVNLPDDVRNEAKSEYDNLFTQQAFYMDKNIPGIPVTLGDRPFTYGELVSKEGLDIQEIFDKDIDLISQQLPSLLEGYSNVMLGGSLFDAVPTTYSKWQDKVWGEQLTVNKTPGEIYKEKTEITEADLRKDWEDYKKKTGDYNLTFEHFKIGATPSDKPLSNLKKDEQTKIDEYIKDVNKYNEAINWLKNNPSHLDKFKPSNASALSTWVDKPALRDEYWKFKKQFKKKYNEKKTIKTDIGEFQKTGFEEISDLVEKGGILDLPKLQD